MTTMIGDVEVDDTALFLWLVREFRYVREAAEQNTGQRVEGIQRWGGGAKGQSWCSYWATMMLDVWFQGNAPIPRKGLCEDVHQLAKKNGWITDEPEPGDIVLSVNEANHAHHIAIVTGTDPLTAIAGNTSADGVSSNGNGVYEHTITPRNKVFVKYPRAEPVLA